MDMVLIALTAFVVAYQLGWQTRRLYESKRRLRHTQAVGRIMQEFKDKIQANATQQAADEYERGCRDGWEQGLNQGVQAARAVINNKRVLTELAARRFLVGGLRAHE